MPRNGSGIYGPPAGTTAVPNSTIESADYNAVVADISQALTDSINVNGTAPFQSNQPMGNNKLTGLASGSAATDSITLGQAQSGIVAHASTIGGSADAISLTFSPAFSAYAAKMHFRFTAAAANTLPNPTVSIDGLGAKTIKKLNGVALEAGDIAGPGHVCECVYDGSDVLLLNFAPMTPAEASVFTAKQTFSRPIVAPIETLADNPTIAWDMGERSGNVRILLSASRNLGAPANPSTGQRGLLIVQQDATGGWSLTPNALFKQSGAQAVLDIDKSANAKTAFAYDVTEDHTAAKIVLLKRLWSEGKTSLGFHKEYTAGQWPTTASIPVTLTLAHGLGRLPAFIQCFIEIASAQFGYAIGDRVDFVGIGDWDNSRNPTPIVNATNVRIRFNDSNAHIQRLDTGGNVEIDDFSTPCNVIVRVYE